MKIHPLIVFKVYHVFILSLVYFVPTVSAVEPRYKAIPSIGWSLDRVLDNTSMGDVTGITVAVDDQGEVRWYENDANGSNYVSLLAPFALTNNTTCVFENDSNPIPDSCVGDGTDGGGSGNSFETLAVPAGASVVADSATDTLTLTETTFLTITGTAATDTIDITQVTTDLGTDGLIAANAVALGTDTTNAYVADLTAGTAIDVSGGGAETATVTVDFDSTEVEGTTWGAGGNASNAWTFNLSGTDPVLTASSNTLTVTGDVAASGIAGPDITATPTGGVAFGLHAEAQGSNTIGSIKNGPRWVLEESPAGLTLGGNSITNSATKIVLRTDGTGDGEVTLPTDSIGVEELDTADTPANAEVLAFQSSTGRMVWSPDAGAAGGDSITVNSSAATDPDFLDGDIDWTLTGGNSITATVGCSGCVDGTDLADTIAIPTELTIPVGAVPNADGEITHDTTIDQIVYGGDADVLDPRRVMHITLEGPTDADNVLLGKLPFGITLVSITCGVDPADSSESVVIDVQERDSAGDNPATVDATITCDNDGAADDGAFTNGTLDAADWWSLDIGTVTGTVTQVFVTVTYQVVGE